MGGFLKFLALLILILPWVPTRAYAVNDPAVEKFLTEVKQKKQSLYSSEKAKQLEPATTPEVVVHFFWASWCEYCDKAHTQLVQIRSDKRVQGKIQVIGYSLDDELKPAVNNKLKEMPDLNHFYVSRKKLTMPKEISRLPLTIVENTKTKELEIFTGFTRERFHYLKKHVLRTLSEQAGDENVE